MTTATMKQPRETPRELAESQSLQCLDVWGGNTETNQWVSVPGLDIHVRSRPWEGADSGGDVYYLSMCGSGNLSRIAVADVSGHGSAVEGITASLRKLMRRHINTADQSKLTRRLNEEFAAKARLGTFATALLTTYYAPTDHLIVSNAGHPRPLLYRAAKKDWLLLDEDAQDAALATSSSVVGVRNIPLGVISGTEYEQFAVRLEPGDVVVVYTDALSETRDDSGQLLNELGLLERFRGLGDVDPSTLADRAIADLFGDGQPDDDYTLIVLHHNASKPPHMSLGEKLRMLGKLIGIGSDRS